MLEEAKKSGIHSLLNVPIILLFSCLVFQEQNSLPKSKTEIYKEIFKLLIDRSAEKEELVKNLDKDSLDDLHGYVGGSYHGMLCRKKQGNYC